MKMKLMQALLSIHEAYSEESIMEFMKEKFGTKKTLAMKNISIPDIENYILLILGSAKANSRFSFYTVEHDEQQKESVEIGNYIMPNLTYIKKEGA